MQEIEDLAAKDNFIIATGMTDPKMNTDDVAVWGAQADAGDLVAVSEAIQHLSGLGKGAGKSRVDASGG